MSFTQYLQTILNLFLTLTFIYKIYYKNQQTADRAARAAGTIYRVVAGTDTALPNTQINEDGLDNSSDIQEGKSSSVNYIANKNKNVVL